jgi:AcrR family transcriptional regulator
LVAHLAAVPSGGVRPITGSPREIVDALAQPGVVVATAHPIGKGRRLLLADQASSNGTGQSLRDMTCLDPAQHRLARGLIADLEHVDLVRREPARLRQVREPPFRELVPTVCVFHARCLSIHRVCVDTVCLSSGGLYDERDMPKLWATTIETHRQEVRHAVMDATAHLVAAQGLRGVTMSAIAEKAGIGRATLYKYFSDVDAILTDWHDEQVEQHLAHLRRLSEQAGGPLDRLDRVLRAYARGRYTASQHADAPEAVRSLHAGDGLSQHEAVLRDLVTDLIADCAAADAVRNDVPPVELAVFALSSLSGGAQAASKAAVQRLVDMTLQTLRG